MAGREVTESQLIEISIVTEPAQRYYVLFLRHPKLSDGDSYDYSLVKFMAERLRSPCSGWTYDWTTILQPHPLFPAGRNDKCPCESGMKYKKCCLDKPGVLRPHCNIHFEEAPPPWFSNYE